MQSYWRDLVRSDLNAYSGLARVATYSAIHIIPFRNHLNAFGTICAHIEDELEEEISGK